VIGAHPNEGFVICDGSSDVFKVWGCNNATTAMRCSASAPIFCGTSCVQSPVVCAQGGTGLVCAASVVCSPIVCGTTCITIGSLKLTGSRVATTATNLHLDALSAGTTYINYYTGTGGTVFGNGASGVVACITGAGLIKGPIVCGTSWLCSGAGVCAASDWFRISGDGGLYFSSYGGGWHMTDSTWIRAYNSKPLYVNTCIQAGGCVYAPYVYGATQVCAPIVCGACCIRTCLVKANILEQNAGASTLCIRTESGTNKDIVISPHGTGKTCIQGNLYVSGMVCTEGIEGDTFNSASCKLNSITCFNTSCSTGYDAIYDIYVSANPNSGGSSVYRDVVHMTSYVTTGWSGSAVTKYINTVEHFNRGDAHVSGAGHVTASVHLLVGDVGCECYAQGCNTCLQIRICGGNTGTNAQYRTAECVLIKRIL